MNLIRKVATDDNLEKILEDIMALTNITSVEDDASIKHTKHKRIRFDTWEEYCHTLIEKGFNTESLELISFYKNHVLDKIQQQDLKILMNYCPSEFGFSLDVPPKNKTKFLAIFPRKKNGFSY